MDGWSTSGGGRTGAAGWRSQWAGGRGRRLARRAARSGQLGGGWPVAAVEWVAEGRERATVATAGGAMCRKKFVGSCCSCLRSEIKEAYFSCLRT
ncbi:uncharacterized protein A4U43_C08F24540 [Asparagus officinalis]|nr:uncharacterized protein A4U43_C08F24540 [Asparagus officinalis]